jgi:thioester reductase-like protein
VVLTTGATSAIGSNTLVELYKFSNVTKIIVLSRKSSTPAAIRQKKVLEDRGLDPGICLGWKVDFNLGLSSFGPNITGVRNLINFALGSTLPKPPRFIFVSTIAVVTRESESIRCVSF